MPDDYRSDGNAIPTGAVQMVSVGFSPISLATTRILSCVVRDSKQSKCVLNSVVSRSPKCDAPFNPKRALRRVRRPGATSTLKRFLLRDSLLHRHDFLVFLTPTLPNIR